MKHSIKPEKKRYLEVEKQLRWLKKFRSTFHCGEPAMWLGIIESLKRLVMMMEKREDKIKVLEDVAESFRSSVVEARLFRREGFPTMTDESICSMKREMEIFRAIIGDYAMANIKGEDKK
jgi:hypothetical protein